MTDLFKNITRSGTFGIFLLLLACAQICEGSTYRFTPTEGKVTFLAIGHPSALKIHGEGPGPEGELQFSAGFANGTLRFNLKALNTGIEMRDRHMKEKYLEVSKFPEAQLKIENLKIPAGATVKEAPFSGVLIMKGVAKLVSGTFSVTAAGARLNIEATFPLKLTDFKVEIPSYMGITVAEDVKLQVSASVSQGDKP